MAQYWLQVPVENAKEVVQRYIDLYNSTLTDYVGKTVSYQSDCEVVFYGADLAAFVPDPNSMYFGTFIVSNPSGEASASIRIQDQATNQLTIIDAGASSIAPGHYPYVMFNRCDSPADANLCFIGYKFDIA
jgi:hypothetical protein